MIAALVLSLSLADPNLSGTPARFAQFPDAEIVYYEVHGDSADEVRAELDRKILSDPATGKRGLARAHHEIGWDYWEAEDGMCEAEVVQRLWVEFPRLAPTARLGRNDLARWDAFLLALEAHEAGHLLRAKAMVPELQAALEDGPCEGSRERAMAVLDRMEAEQEDYDERTRHGVVTGAYF